MENEALVDKLPTSAMKFSDPNTILTVKIRTGINNREEITEAKNQDKCRVVSMKQNSLRATDCVPSDNLDMHLIRSWFYSHQLLVTFTHNENSCIGRCDG